jgi:methionyl aminopeptidase
LKLRRGNEIKKIREAGLILWETHQKARQFVEKGITTRQIDNEIECYINSRNAIALFKGVSGKIPYPAASCISVNEQVVHGIPSNYRLSEGDLVSIDIGIKYKGWCADAAVTYKIGNISKQCTELLEATEHYLKQTIQLLATKSHWSCIVKETSKRINDLGFSIVEDLVGHAIGKDMWELPQVPNFFSKKNTDFIIKPGLVLAIEPMINLGKKHVKTLKDGWTIVTKDGMPSAHFEHTVAITNKGPYVLTCGPDNEGWAMY